MASEKEIGRLIAVTRSLMRQWEGGPAAWLARLAEPLPSTLADDAAVSVRELVRLLGFDPFADLAGEIADAPKPGGGPGPIPRPRTLAPDRPATRRRPGNGSAPHSVHPAQRPIAAAKCAQSRPPPQTQTTTSKATAGSGNHLFKADAPIAKNESGTLRKFAKPATGRAGEAVPDSKPVDRARAAPVGPAMPAPSAAERLAGSRRAWARQRPAAQPSAADEPPPARGGVDGIAPPAASRAKPQPGSVTKDPQPATPPGLRHAPGVSRTPSPPAPSTAQPPPRATAAPDGDVDRPGRGRPDSGGDAGTAATRGRAASVTIDPINANPVAPPSAPAPAVHAVPDDDLAQRLADSAYLHGIDQT